MLRLPNAKLQPRLEAEAKRKLQGVGCKLLLGVVFGPCMGCPLFVDPTCKPFRHRFRRQGGRVQHPHLPARLPALPRCPPHLLHAGSAFPLDDVGPPLRIDRM